jgi:hypothetical protein
MNIKDVSTKVSFSDSITNQEAMNYIEDTLNDASGMKINITWGFDEAQADSFHKSWTGEKFLQCIEKILQ